MTRFLLIATLVLGAVGARADGENVVAGAGSAKFNALLQFWTLDDTTAAADAYTNFRVRRAELKFSGSVVENTRWFVMIDPAKSLKTGTIAATNDNKILQDLGIAYKLNPELELLAGQFKVPTTTESFIASTDLLFAERAYVTRLYGDRREPGMMLDYMRKPFRVRLMVSNGVVSSGAAGTNIDDTNNSKDVNGRIDYTINDDIKAAVFVSNSHSTLGMSNRQGANVTYSHDKLLVSVEGVQAKEFDIDYSGMVADAAYMLSDYLQLAARYENFQRLTDPAASGAVYSGGLNYFLAKNNSKIQLTYSALNNFSGSNGSYVPVAGKQGSVVVLNLQTAL